MTRKYRHTDARQAVTEPPRGVPFMRLERRRDETAAAARERAKTMPWWGDVTNSRPYVSARFWMFQTGKPKEAT
jgi:hypothetical protein